MHADQKSMLSISSYETWILISPLSLDLSFSKTWILAKSVNECLSDMMRIQIGFPMNIH